jgi:hypothetical protein
MLDFVFEIFWYFRLFSGFCLFTYIYKYFFEICNEKKTIKEKDNKQKKVIKSKITISLLYLTLTIILYFTLTLRILIAIVTILVMLLMVLTQSFDPMSMKSLTNLDSNKFVKKIWSLIYIFFNILFKILKPIHNIIESKLTTKKNQIMTALSTINVGGMNLGMLNGLGGLGGLGDLGGFVNSFGSGKSENNKSSGFNQLEKLLGNMGANKKNANDKTGQTEKNETSQSDINKYLLTDKINPNAKTIIEDSTFSTNTDTNTDSDIVSMFNKMNGVFSTIDTKEKSSKLNKLVSNIESNKQTDMSDVVDLGKKDTEIRDNMLNLTQKANYFNIDFTDKTS